MFYIFLVVLFYKILVGGVGCRFKNLYWFFIVL